MKIALPAPNSPPAIYVVAQYLNVRDVADAGRLERVLVVDDEGDWVDVVTEALRGASVSALVVSNSAEAPDITKRQRPQIVIVGVCRPWSPSLVVCRRLCRMSSARLIVVTSDGAVVRSMRNLRVDAESVTAAPTADDCGVRLQSMLRGGRSAQAPQPIAPGHGGPRPDKRVFGPLCIDIAQRQVFVADAQISLTRIQFDILAALAQCNGGVLSRRELLTAVWGSRFAGSPNLVDIHIGRLRRRLGDNPAKPLLVLNVRGVGFRLAGEGWRS
ncbi:response regulator transcription factor [Mycolicibacterium mageritense]|uniref:response regulator transcription factor n=1 Tax=Mycolicibacterium mageritense TaxID=53462 RepID=UPI0023F42A60|nr:response regulator transcription factor [Mycolicibacterium mageritense]